MSPSAWAQGVIFTEGAHAGETVAAVLAQGAAGRRYVEAASRQGDPPVREAARILLGLGGDTPIVQVPSVSLVFGLESPLAFRTIVANDGEERRLRDWICSQPDLADLIVLADKLRKRASS